jgi:hypothetical protein
MDEKDVLVHLSFVDKDDILDSCDGHVAEKLKNAMDSGNMVILDSYKFYCNGGTFDIRRNLENWEGFCEYFRSKGFDGIVVVGDLSWSADDPELLSKVMDYEASATMSGLPENLTAVCQYDTRRYSDDDLRKLSMIHELMVDTMSLKRNYWLLSAKHQ